MSRTINFEPIGLRAADDLGLMPTRYHAPHEFCFHLHDTMLGILKSAEESRIADLTVDFAGPDDAQTFAAAPDAFAGFFALGRADVVQTMVRNQMCLALYADMLHFFFEGLRALEKRKFTVALSLLRKPLKENLLLIAWLCADEVNFFEKLNESPVEHMRSSRLTPDRRRAILSAAISRISNGNIFDADVLHSMLFDKKKDFGLAPLFDMATHLVTHATPAMHTEELNLNFIFKDHRDDDVYKNIYGDLAYALAFLLSMQIDLYGRMQPLQPYHVQWLPLQSAATYSSLFLSGPNALLRSLIRTMGEFMNCPYCGTRTRVSRAAAPRFLVAEQLSCGTCGQDHHFPLFWLMSKSFNAASRGSRI